MPCALAPTVPYLLIALCPRHRHGNSLHVSSEIAGPPKLLGLDWTWLPMDMKMHTYARTCPLCTGAMPSLRRLGIDSKSSSLCLARFIKNGGEEGCEGRELRAGSTRHSRVTGPVGWGMRAYCACGGPLVAADAAWAGALPPLLGWCRCAGCPSCIMHDHVNGGPPQAIPPDRQGHCPRCDKMTIIYGQIHTREKKGREREKKKKKLINTARAGNFSASRAPGKWGEEKKKKG
jgi:hypothetical protein